MAVDDGEDKLSERVAELEREAEEQMELQEITANGYMKRLHLQLAESLQMEARMLRQRGAGLSRTDGPKRRSASSAERDLRDPARA